LIKNLVTVFLLISPCVNASSALVFRFTEQGYWYGKAYNIMFSGYENSGLPSEIAYKSAEDMYDRLSPAETLCFLSGILRNNHPALRKLTLWSYIKDKKLKIPEKDILSLKSDNSIFKLHLENYKWLLEKIKKFWGLRDKSIHLHCFYSRPDGEHPHFSGAWLANFYHRDNVYAIVLMCSTSLASGEVTLREHLGVLAHEFTHAMCDAAYGREKFETVTAKFSSPNAVVVGWYLNEALAVILGNCIFQEIISQKKIDPKKEEYCARGFAPALYELTKHYFGNSKVIDESFFRNAVEIFDKVHPNGYKDPNICLYKVYAVCADSIEENRIIMKLSRKTTVSSFHYATFSGLTIDKIKEIENKDSTLLIIFSDEKQLDSLKNLLPKFDDKVPIGVVHKNRRTYILVKVDDKHSLEDRIDELFSKTNN
jgi:hypothetical protein